MRKAQLIKGLDSRPANPENHGPVRVVVLGLVLLFASCETNQTPTDITSAEPTSATLSARPLYCIPPPCTHTIGWWKTHPEAWSGIGGLVLGKLYYYTPAELLRILKQPVRGNGLVSLAHQLIGAKLNLLGGYGDPAIDDLIADADDMIGDLLIPPISAPGLPRAGYLPPAMTSGLVTGLTNWNEGTTGPGHCPD